MKNKEVYIIRKLGSTFASATINAKQADQAKKNGYKVFQSLDARKAWQDKNKSR